MKRNGRSHFYLLTHPSCTINDKSKNKSIKVKHYKRQAQGRSIHLSVHFILTFVTNQKAELKTRFFVTLHILLALYDRESFVCSINMMMWEWRHSNKQTNQSNTIHTHTRSAVNVIKIESLRARERERKQKKIRTAITRWCCIYAFKLTWNRL